MAEISSAEHVWVRGGGGDPILVGMTVKEGVLKRGTPLCVERRGQTDANGLQSYLDIGRVIGLEHNRKPVDSAKVGAQPNPNLNLNPAPAPTPNPHPHPHPNPNPNPNLDPHQAGMSVSVKIDAVTSVAYGRQFDLTYAFHR